MTHTNTNRAEPNLDRFKFNSEFLLQQAIAKLLSRIPGIDEVTILHGAQEYGKDIIFRTTGPFDDIIHCACVIKNHKISGKAGDRRNARSVVEQIEQALEIPYMDGAGNKIFIQRIYVISPEEVSQTTIHSIEGKLSLYRGKIVFFGGHQLFDLFQRYWADFFADEFDAMESYLKNLETLATSISPLSEMASLYSLGEIDKQESTIYVERSFYRTIPSYDFRSLFGVMPGKLPLREKHKKNEVEKIVASVLDLRKKIAHVENWGYTKPTPSLSEIDLMLNDFQESLHRSWTKNAKNAQLANERRESLSVPHYIVAPIDSDGSLEKDSKILTQVIRDWLLPARELCRITQQISRLKVASSELLHTRLWEIAGYFDDCLRAAPLKFPLPKHGSEVNFTEGEIRLISEDLLIVGAAGYGKTSFCRRNCLVDAQLFREGKSKIFPIYIPLHTLAGTKCESFNDVFLKGLGRSALLDANLLKDAEAIRLYLDGLDEISSEDQQQKLLELARSHRMNIGVQVVLTSRDYLFGKWLQGFRRIQLGALTTREFEELKAKWLGPDSTLLKDFERQILKLPALMPVLKVPLLATLVVLVFRQKRTLPESRTGLYGAFVDLLSGGWDLAKNVLRVSHFDRNVKLMVLADLAATAHTLGQRDFSKDRIAASVCRIVSKADQKQCEDLCNELLVDGVLARAGAQYYFSHLSFQEFLTAKYMIGDPSSKEANSALSKFIDGDDWWREVLRFYIGLSQNPESVTRWLRNQFVKRTTSGERSAVLFTAVQEFFPSFQG